MLDYFYGEDLTENDFREARDYWREGRNKCKQQGLRLTGNKVYFLCQSDTNYRRLKGDFARSYLLPSSLDIIVDSALISNTPKYAFTERLYKP